MAKSFLIRFIGMMLALIAAASLVFTGYALLQTWRLKGPATRGLQSGLEVISGTLGTTSNSLTTIDGSLQAISGSLSSLQTTALSAANSLHSQATSIQALGSLFSTDLPNALTGAQTAMIGAQAGAKSVEDTLSVLTSNPAFAATPDQPAIPLSDALSGVAAGLGALPAPMKAVGGNLSATSTDINGLQTTVANFATSLDGMHVRLAAARKSTGSYRAEVDKLGGRVARLRANIPGWISTAAWVITFVLGWLAILQFYWLGRGLRWMVRGE